MDAYHIVLFIHILTLVVAASAAAVVKLAVGRRARARTVGEVLDWHNVMSSAARVFPMTLASFVITGAYMLSRAGTHAWSTGFVVAGLVGVTFLLASGTFLGIKGKGLAQMLEGMAKHGADQPAPKLVPPPVLMALPTVNTGIAIAVTFDMVTKPASLPVALGVLAVGAVLGALPATRRRPAPAIEQARAA